MNREKVVRQTTVHAEKVQDALDCGQPPLKRDCTALIDDLSNLHACILEEAAQPCIADADIEILFKDFSEHMDQATHYLQGMEDLLTDGKIPPQGQVSTFTDSVDLLRQKYDAICRAAAQLLPAEELPDADAPAEAYVSAVRNSCTLQIKKQLDDAALCLEKFISIRSQVERYTSALSDYQNQAAVLLTAIRSGSELDEQTLKDGTDGPKTILAAIECEDKDSDQGLALCDKVERYYPGHVHTGVVANKYYIDAEILKEVQAQQMVENAKALERDCAPAEKDRKVEPAEPPEEAPKTEADAVSENPSGAENGEAQQDAKTAGFIRLLRNGGAFLNSDAEIGEASLEISQNEEKKITASIFQNEMRQGFVPTERYIFREIESRLWVTQKTLAGWGVSQKDAEQGLAYLHKKGYLRKFGLQPELRIYLASPRLIRALQFRDACKFADVRQKTFQNWTFEVNRTAAEAAALSCCSELYAAARERLAEAGFQELAGEGSSSSDMFCCSLYNILHTDACEVFLGAFWTEDSGCGDFLYDVKQMLVKHKKIGTLTVASLHQAQAKALAGALLEALSGELTAESILLYSFAEQAFAPYHADTSGSGEVYHEKPDTGEHAAETKAAEAAADVRRESPAEPGSEPAAQAAASEHMPAAQAARPIAAKKEAAAASFCAETMYSLLAKNHLYAACTYLKAFSGMDAEAERAHQRLMYAVNDPAGHCTYSSERAFDLISEQEPFTQCLSAAIALRTFFSNQVRYDHSIKPFYTMLKSYPILDRYPSLGKALYVLAEFKNAQEAGADAYAEYRAKSRTELEREISMLRKDAGNFYENFVAGHKKEKCRQKRFLETKNLIFSANSDFGQYIKAAADGDDDIQPLAVDFLQKNFYSDDAVLAEDTFDGPMLWSYILKHWEEAGDHVMYKRREDLKSRLRSNITNETTKAVQLLARWCNLVDMFNRQSNDAGRTEYSRIRAGLFENLCEAGVKIADDRKETDIDADAAGFAVLADTIDELKSCMDGSFLETTRKYFYAPFLLTGDVVLGEDFLPDYEARLEMLPTLRLEQRVLDHVSALERHTCSYESRLYEILNDHGDDYGSARRLVEYLSLVKPDADLTEAMRQIELGEPYAKEAAEVARTDFIGELELAQSYGQIDNSIEDKKEQILQIVGEWYDWANDTANYGFFRHVLDAYLQNIRHSAKAREQDLRMQLEKIKAASVQGLSLDTKRMRVARIQEMINDQNYTVAEDLLARFAVIEDEYEERIEEDFLKEFLDHYDDYYSPVARTSVSFSTLVNSRTRNKEEKGAKRLADNWLPGGSALGKERLANLLSCLGFRIESIQQPTASGRFETYRVCGKQTENGKRIRYPHPIAAFGSGLAKDGAQIVCINGQYSADMLIETIKNIGDAKHTLILLDSALSKSERRRLARKSKNALGEKLFGVIDRTVMMFLVRNYNETKVNRMLLSLITPFGYYQPYVWDSANVMPPEIFMGRKNELERIKSPSGVNIVYGGRQLGKSALLKKAREEIDFDENHDRAVYIEIKGRTYAEAARKIGHELYDQGILEQDVDTEDWDELTRLVKRRLQSATARPIPYLLLLLDEADVFIESCEAVNYKPFDALKEIQSIGSGRFKFVIAGLRNVVRFKREAALGNNSVLTHLQSMTVKPFNTSEARELLEIPLHYLGLRFPKEKESLITLILATTNYFPGLIQLYCAKLVEAMRSKDYAGYNEADAPIYEVSEDHIKKVLSDPAFMQQIREKYEITLKLDEDNYYYLIALLMAYLYHSNGYSAGYTAGDIKAVGTELGITKISALEEAKLSAFMEELKELNVLRSTDESHYLFTRVTFFQMMGTSTEVDDKLEPCMGV